MDTISKAKKLQAMHSLKTQFYYNLMFRSFLALTCSLLFSFPLWFPSLCSSMELFLSLSIRNKFSSFFSPKCLFIMVNVIVVFLVGESRFGGSHSSPVGEIYDEYVERSWSLRGVSAHQVKAEESKLEVNLVDQETNVQDKEVVLEEEVAELSNKEDKEVVVKEEDDREVNREVNELTSKGKKDAHEEVKVKEDRHEEKEISEEEEEESGLPPEELNRRVEEFIARVHKQRWLQAQLLACCKA